MPRISFSKESLEGPPPVPDGVYEVRLEGFEPKLSKDRQSVNLQPQIKIINHATLTGRQIYDNLNTQASWIIESFCHCFGYSLITKPDGSSDLPGEFLGPDDDPTKWSYVGPLSGMVGKVVTKQVLYNNRMSSKVDQWIDAVPGSTLRPVTGLAR